MSKQHKVTVRKYNRTPGLGTKPMWWADCSCGSFQGYHQKQDAQSWADKHPQNAGHR